MRVLIVLVTRNEVARKVFIEQKEAVVPKTLRDQIRGKGNELLYVTGTYSPASDRSLEQYILDTSALADAVVVLVDARELQITRSISTACLRAVVDLSGQEHNLKNTFSGVVAKAVKSILMMLDAMADAGKQQPLLLPLRNFDAQEIVDLAEMFRGNAVAGNNRIEMNNIIGRLNGRKRPRRNSSSKKKYYVDDAQKMFEYGKEHHAVLETGGDHVALCCLTGNFRFGCRVEANRHFNVSKEWGAQTRISGTFPGCHGNDIAVSPTTHINMFVNDSQA